MAAPLLLVVVRRPETDRALRSSGRGDQPSQRLEDLIQLLVVSAEPLSGLSLKLFEPILKRRVGGGRAAQLDERSHDLDIDGNRALAAQHPRKHGYALLGEDVGGVATPAPAGL